MTADEKLRDALGKRLITISRFQITLGIIVALTFLQALNANGFSNDIRALALIAQVNQIAVKTAFEDGTLNNALSAYLEQHDLALADQQRAVREGIDTILLRYNIGEDNLATVKGRLDGPNRYSVIDLDMEETLRASFSPAVNYSVNQYIDRFNELLTPRSLMVGSTLNSIDFIEAGEYEVQPQFFCQNAEVKSVMLRESTIFVTVGENLALLDGLNQNRPCGDFSRTLNVTTTQVAAAEDTSIYDFVAEDDGSFAEIQALYEDVEQQIRLRRLYGNVQFVTAQNIVASNYTGSYGNVSIFGFTFFKPHYVFAVVVIALILSGALYSTIHIARKKPLRIISEVDDPNIVDAILSNDFARFCLFAFVSVITVLLVGYNFPFDATIAEKVIYYGGILLTGGLGIAAFLESREL